MAFVKFSNGYVSMWDDTITVGTLITTYHSGYHVLERIEFREIPKNHCGVTVVEHDTQDSYPPVFHYVKVLSSAGDKSKVIRNSCEASFCKRVTAESVIAQYQAEIEAAAKKREAISQFI